MSLKTLATLACLSLAGTAGGVWLGGAAIGEIDPFFFTKPESTFVSDRMAYRSPDWAEVQIGEYQQEGLLDGIGRSPMPGAVYASPAVASYGESWTSAAEQESAPEREWAPPPEPVRVRVAREEPVRVWAAEAAPRPELEPEWQPVERYARSTEPHPDEVMESAEAEPEVYAAVQEVGAE